MNDVVAVVVTYNRLELLKECIRHLREQTYKCDILVVDNASTDGTQDVFGSGAEDLIYCNTGENLGGAGGFSYGIKKAVETGYKYVWILDDDTMPSPRALDCFMRADQKLAGNYGFLCSKVLWKDDSICTMNIQKTSKWARIKDFDKTQKVQYASFVSLFLKADTIKQVGLPYKEFFIWADDWEYTRRISKRYNCYFVPASIVHHCCASNVGADIVTTEPARMDRFQYMYRNDVVMYRQDGAEGMLYLFLRNTVHVIRILSKTENKRQKIGLLLKFTMSGLKFRPEIDYPGAGK